MNLPRPLLHRIRRAIRRQLMQPVFLHGTSSDRPQRPGPEADGQPIEPIPGPLFYAIIFALSLLAPVAFYLAARADAAHDRAQLPPPDKTGPITADEIGSRWDTASHDDTKP